MNIEAFHRVWALSYVRVYADSGNVHFLDILFIFTLQSLSLCPY